MALQGNAPEGNSSGRWLESSGAISHEENQEIYQNLFESFGGQYRNLQADVLKDLNSKNFAIQKAASDVKKTPISSTLLEAFTQAGIENPQELMYFALHYLQENDDNKDINDVSVDSQVEVYKSGDRWKLKVTNTDGAIALDGFILPEAPSVEAPAAETPPEPLAKPAPTPETPNTPDAPPDVPPETSSIKTFDDRTEEGPRNEKGHLLSGKREYSDGRSERGIFKENALYTGEFTTVTGETYGVLEGKLAGSPQEAQATQQKKAEVLASVTNAILEKPEVITPIVLDNPELVRQFLVENPELTQKISEKLEEAGGVADDLKAVFAISASDQLTWTEGWEAMKAKKEGGQKQAIEYLLTQTSILKDKELVKKMLKEVGKGDIFGKIIAEMTPEEKAKMTQTIIENPEILQSVLPKIAELMKERPDLVAKIMESLSEEQKITLISSALLKNPAIAEHLMVFVLNKPELMNKLIQNEAMKAKMIRIALENPAIKETVTEEVMKEKLGVALPMGGLGGILSDLGLGGQVSDLEEKVAHDPEVQKDILEKVKTDPNFRTELLMALTPQEKMELMEIGMKDPSLAETRSAIMMEALKDPDLTAAVLSSIDGETANQIMQFLTS